MPPSLWVINTNPRSKPIKLLDNISFVGVNPKDGSLIIVRNQNGKSILWMARLSQANRLVGLRSLLTNQNEVYSALWSPDGKRIAMLSHADNSSNTIIRIVNTTKAQNELILGQPTVLAVGGCAWSPDGYTFVYVAQSPGMKQGSLMSYDLVSGISKVTTKADIEVLQGSIWWLHRSY